MRYVSTYIATITTECHNIHTYFMEIIAELHTLATILQIFCDTNMV